MVSAATRPVSRTALAKPARVRRSAPRRRLRAARGCRLRSRHSRRRRRRRQARPAHRAGGRAEALVAHLMGVEGGGMRRVGRVLGRPALDAVVGQHGVEGRPPRSDRGREACDELRRDEIEQRRGGDEIGARPARRRDRGRDRRGGTRRRSRLPPLSRTSSPLLPVRAVGPGRRRSAAASSRPAS